MSGTFNSFSDYAALSQRDIVASVRSFVEKNTPTLNAYDSARKMQGQQAGVKIPFNYTHSVGGGTINPLAGSTSFTSATPEKFEAMYGGLVYRFMNIALEATMLTDLENGKLSDSYVDMRRRRVATFNKEKNLAFIGDSTGTIAVVASAAVSTLTCKADNSARRASSGSFYLMVSDSTNKIWYSAYNTSTDAEVARFFVTAKPSTTTATVDFTGGVGNIAALNVAGLCIVRTDYGWKKEICGNGYHANDSTSRVYQGQLVSNVPQLAAAYINGGAAAVTPTLFDTAKETLRTRANDQGASNGYRAFMSPGNYNTLKNFGYTSRQYQAANGGADTTFGLPKKYTDGDTEWIIDADYEEAYIDFMETSPFFIYEQKPFGLKTTDGIGRHEWAGSNTAGSTESWENYTENLNLVWDARGADQKGAAMGRANTTVFIGNLALPSVRRTASGVPW